MIYIHREDGHQENVCLCGRHYLQLLDQHSELTGLR
jgi:hypothetical protein